MQNRNLIEKYNLPAEVKFCKKCVISNQRPRITFDANGVCSACNFAEMKRNQFDWDEREQELVALCNNIGIGIVTLTETKTKTKNGGAATPLRGSLQAPHALDDDSNLSRSGVQSFPRRPVQQRRRGAGHLRRQAAPRPRVSSAAGAEVHGLLPSTGLRDGHVHESTSPS